MNIKEAAEWSKENDAPVTRPCFYRTPNEKLSNVDGYFRREGEGPAVPIEFESVFADDWQPWQEPREYVGFWEAMADITKNCVTYRYDVKDFPADYFCHNGEVWFASKTGGFQAQQKFIPCEAIMQSKWYIVKQQESK